MSRGGRGGGFGGKPRIGGVEVNWEGVDYSAGKEYKPDEIYPAISKPAYQKPIRNEERRQVAAYRRLRDNIHEGDFYTVLSAHNPGHRIGKKTPAPVAPKFDAFESMQSYSHKYTKQHRRFPRLQGRPWIMRFFPEELRSTIDPSYAKDPKAAANGASIAQPKKRALRILSAHKRSRMELGMERAEREGGGDDDDDATNPDRVKEDDEVERDGFNDEPVDDDYEEDEDDGDDDYNAERYFDDDRNDYDNEETGAGGDDGGDY